MESSDRHARIIIKPYNDASALRIEAGMIGAGNEISPPAAGHERERFKWSRFQVLPDIANHAGEYNSG